MTSRRPALKTVKQILPRPRPHWVGDGFHVYPVFADYAFTNALSPFLMFDYGAPKVFPARNDGQRPGVGRHPHRGFETVTIAFQGEVEHADSKGNRGVIGAGDVQWMSAARGIVHEEFHSTEFTKRGGVIEMCQLWVNLPAARKMGEPRYQPILAGDIPEVPLAPFDEEASTSSTCEEEGSSSTVRIIAGDFGGVRGPADTVTQMDVWDVTLSQQGRIYNLPTVPGNNVIVFVRRGRIQVQGQELGPQDVAIMDPDGDGSDILIETLEPQSCVLLLAGEPIDEPIAARGPFVMNTFEEIIQANDDYRNGRF